MVRSDPDLQSLLSDPSSGRTVPIGPWLGMLRPIASWVRLSIIWPVNENNLSPGYLTLPITHICSVSSRRRGLPPGTRIFFGDQNSCDARRRFLVRSFPVCAFATQPSEAAQLPPPDSPVASLELYNHPPKCLLFNIQLRRHLLTRGRPAEIRNGSRAGALQYHRPGWSLITVDGGPDIVLG